MFQQDVNIYNAFICSLRCCSKCGFIACRRTAFWTVLLANLLVFSTPMWSILSEEARRWSPRHRQQTAHSAKKAGVERQTKCKDPSFFETGVTSQTCGRSVFCQFENASQMQASLILLRHTYCSSLLSSSFSLQNINVYIMFCFTQFKNKDATFKVHL